MIASAGVRHNAEQAKRLAFTNLALGVLLATGLDAIVTAAIALADKRPASSSASSDHHFRPRRAGVHLQSPRRPRHGDGLLPVVALSVLDCSL